MTGVVTIRYRLHGLAALPVRAAEAELVDVFDRGTLLGWMLTPWKRYYGHRMYAARGGASVDIDGLRPDQHTARAGAAARALDGIRA